MQDLASNDNWVNEGVIYKEQYLTLELSVPGIKPRDEDTEFVQNKVRWATDYLRTVLGVSPNTVIARDEPRSFESGLPADLSSNPFALHHQRVSAVVTLLYQIRCNLFHGVKGFRNGSRRDELLTTLGVEVIRDVVAALVAQNNADTLPEI